MIYIDRIITIQNNQATIDQQIVLYKGDKNVQLFFTLKDNYLKYKSMENAYGQLIIKRPNANPIFSEQARLSSSKVTFVITGEMIDELVELGEYDFQIRLFSQDKTSRGTLPPITSGIQIKEPILEEEVPNEVGVATVNEVEIVAEDIELEVFDKEGKYNKTNWQDGDIISDVKLNKIEQAIYEINEKEVEVDISNLATKEELSDLATKEELNTELEELEVGILETVNEALETKSNEGHTHEEYAQIDNSVCFNRVEVLNSTPTTTNELVSVSYANKTYSTKEHTHEEYAKQSIVSTYYARLEDLHEHDNKHILDNITQTRVIDWDNKSEFDGDYNNLTNKPTIPSIEGLASEEYVDGKVGEIVIPTKVSELENDSSFATQTFVSDAINKAQFEGNDNIDLSIYAKLEDLHEHDNKALLDTITEEKWNNKAELNSPTFIGNVKIEREEDYTDNGIGLSIGLGANANKGALAIGYGANADNNSLAIGYGANANNRSLKVGSGHATGEYSVAFGINTITSKQYQFVHGIANIEDEGDTYGINGKYAHIVGNGYVDDELGLIRSNAYTLDWQGNGWYQGKLTIEGTPTDDKDVTTKLYVDTLVGTKANENHFHNQYALTENIPTKVSELENDSKFITSIPSQYITETELENKGYLTEHQSLNGYAKLTDIPTKVSELENDSNFLTEHQSLDDYAKLTDIPSLEGYAKKEELITNTDTTITNVNLTTNKYQYVDVSNLIQLTFQLPSITEFTEIHIFFDLLNGSSEVGMGCAYGTVKYQGGYEDFGAFFNEGGSYEIIATYIPNTTTWLVGAVRYN